MTKEEAIEVWTASRSQFDKIPMRVQESFEEWWNERQQQLNPVDLVDVGGALRELADKYEMDALERYETGDHALSHLHMAAQARYGFEDGWNAAKKQ